MKISSTVPGTYLIQNPVWDPKYATDQRRDTKETYYDFVNQLP